MSRYTWGWTSSSADDGGRVRLTVDFREGDIVTVLLSGYPEERHYTDSWQGGGEAAQRDPEGWRLFVNAQRREQTRDRKTAIPRLIAQHVLRRKPTPDEISIVASATRKSTVFDLATSWVRTALQAQPTEEQPVTDTATAAAPIMLPLDKIQEAPDNLRVDYGDLEELAASIKSGGIQQALTVTGGGLDDTYLLVDGHRRYRAARMAGLAEAPVFLKQMTEAERTEAMLVTALHREDLNPIEQARGFQRLVDLKWGQRKIAQRMFGSEKQQGRVSKALKLLKIPEAAQQKVTTGELTLEIARELADMPAESQARAIAEGELGNLEYSIRSEKQRLAAEAAEQKMHKTLTDRGIVILKRPDLEENWRYLGYTWEGPDAPAPHDHDDETCVAALPTGGTNIQWYCTDPARHPQTEAEQLSTGADAAADAERKKRQAELDLATAARREIITTILGKPTAEDQVAIAVQAVVLLAREFGTESVCEFLGIEVEDTGWDRHENALIAEARSGDAQRILAAIVLLQPEGELSHGLGGRPADFAEDFPEIRAHLHLLISHGYEPSDDEKTLLEAPVPAEAEDAAA